MVRQALAHAVEHGTLAINPIVYAEVAIGYASPTQVDAVLPADRFARLALPFAAGILAGRAFLAYRRRGGGRQSPLPDFYIGAHALVEGHTLLTHDRRAIALIFPS